MQTTQATGFRLGTRTKWLGIALMLVAFGFCLWRGVRVYPHYKHRRLVAQARLFLQNGRYQEAMLTAQQILAANPTNLEACRVMADLTERGKDPSTLVWRRQVAQLSPTLENRLTLAAAALLFERPPFPLARQTLEGIQTDRLETAAYHAIAAQLALKLNRVNDAETHFQEAIKLEPQKESYQLNLAVLRLQSLDPTVMAEARATLERLTASPRLGPFALRELVNDSLEKKDLERAQQFSERLLPRPEARFGDRVQHLDILYGTHSPAFDAFFSLVRNEARSEEHTSELQSRFG